MGLSVCPFLVYLSSRFLSIHGSGGYQTWGCATGARHSKGLEPRCQRTACLGGEAKCTVCAFLVKAESGGYQTYAWICG